MLLLCYSSGTTSLGGSSTVEVLLYRQSTVGETHLGLLGDGAGPVGRSPGGGGSARRLRWWHPGTPPGPELAAPTPPSTPVASGETTRRGDSEERLVLFPFPPFLPLPLPFPSDSFPRRWALLLLSLLAVGIPLCSSAVARLCCDGCTRASQASSAYLRALGRSLARTITHSLLPSSR